MYRELTCQGSPDRCGGGVRAGEYGQETLRHSFWACGSVTHKGPLRLLECGRMGGVSSLTGWTHDHIRVIKLFMVKPIIDDVLCSPKVLRVLSVERS